MLIYSIFFVLSWSITLILASPAKRDATPWTWGYVGDSWASGVAYSSDSSYDGNAGGCLRYDEAAGPQLSRNTEWWGSKSEYKSDFRDAACSGSILKNIFLENGQIQQTGNPNLVILTAGGNNCVESIKKVLRRVLKLIDVPGLRRHCQEMHLPLRFLGRLRSPV